MLNESKIGGVALGNIRYSRHWRLKKLGFMSPLEARQADAMRKAA
jgi:hypothetical protein